MRKNSDYLKYMTCALCGQAGKPLTVHEGKEGTNYYKCADRDFCRGRIRLESLLGKHICSNASCIEAAIYQCSCGMLLCEIHAQMYKHSKKHLLLKL